MKLPEGELSSEAHRAIVELTAVEVGLHQTEQKASRLVQSLSAMWSNDPSGIVTQSMEAEIEQTNVLHRQQVKRRDELLTGLAKVLSEKEVTPDTLQYTDDIKLGLEQADHDTQRQVLEALKIAITINNGDYQIRSVLGKSEGRVRAIPRAYSQYGHGSATHP